MTWNPIKLPFARPGTTLGVLHNPDGTREIAVPLCLWDACPPSPAMRRITDETVAAIKACFPDDRPPIRTRLKNPLRGKNGKFCGGRG